MTLDVLVKYIIELSTLIGAVSSILAIANKIYKKQLKNILDPLKDDIKVIKEDINNQLIELDVSQCKNYLVRFLKDIEQGNDVDEVEKERAYEVYDHYSKDLHKNSYIHDKWNKLMK